MDEKVIEKIYCNGGNNNGYGYGYDYAMNNPFAYMMIMGMMRFMYGDNWQNQIGGNAEMQSRFNQISNQMSDNHNTDILADLAKGNYARIGELATNLGVDMRAIQAGLCDVRSGVQGVQGDVRFTGERVINANLMGVKDMQSTFKDCCCENRLAQKDTIIAMKDQTYQLNERMTGIANGLQKGFSDLGYILAQQKGEIINNQDRNTQRIVDTLKDHWNWEQSQALQDQKFENSQLRQNIYMRDLFEKGDGSGCGYNR